MPRIRIEVSRDLAVPPQAAYRVIADYRAGHPRIIPPRAFRDLTVERGGVGAGTIIRFRMRIGGVEREYRATVTEPEPGRVLVETNDSGEVSTFTVDPAPGGGARVTIATEWEGKGIAGWGQRLVAPGLLRPVYDEELRNLERVAAEA
ncbi:MAG TPA: SRPBCC family protein [Verrucomicrobiae bacterium]|nr:SRPBCC family protein [Verrucomicrobiae bacterium]